MCPSTLSCCVDRLSITVAPLSHTSACVYLSFAHFSSYLASLARLDRSKIYHSHLLIPADAALVLASTPAMMPA